MPVRKLIYDRRMPDAGVISNISAINDVESISLYIKYKIKECLLYNNILSVYRRLCLILNALKRQEVPIIKEVKIQ